MNERVNHITVFYRLLGQLENKYGGKRILSECDGRMGWPKRGVYFFFEPGEYRANESMTLRVVRVGTHAVSRGSRSTLWKRLRTHRGTRTGGGNHRGSIFRLHIGNALINRSEGVIDVPTWSQGQSAPKEVKLKEAEHERRVSNYIGQMPFLWIDIDDEPSPESNRALVEKNAIAMLAGEDGASPHDPPSVQWLGYFSPNSKIRNSGLWNLNYVGVSEKTIPYDPVFLDILKQHI